MPRNVGRNRERQAGLAAFPCSTCLTGCPAEGSVQDLLRLLDLDLNSSQFFDGPNARKLVATWLKAYRDSQSDERWVSDPFLAQLGSDGGRLAMVLSAAFDFVTNVEYCSTRLRRLTDSKWIYCNAASKEGPPGKQARVFFAFLKQCPHCCLTLGLGARIEGAQHKPASHHSALDPIRWTV